MADAAGAETRSVENDPVETLPAVAERADDRAAFLARLEAAPYKQGFYQVMRLLEAAYPDKPRFGRSARPSQDPVRLGQDPEVTFAASTLAAWERRGDLPPLLVVNFFGLFGTDGPLPLHLTEYARDRKRLARDATFQRFADVFHHRALSLFWRAWADSRPTISFDRPKDDRFATYVGALTGYGMDSVRDRDAMPDLTKLHFAGLFSNQTRHAEGLAAILSAFFAMPVRIVCFIGDWLTLDERDRTRLGGKPENAVMGQSVLLGSRVWSRTQKFRIVFGPLSIAEYLRLLPGGVSFHRLIPIVRNYVGDTLTWDVNLVLREREVPKMELGKQGRLGWTTWLGGRRDGTDGVELFLNAGADSLAQQIDRHDSAQ